MVARWENASRRVRRLVACVGLTTFSVVIAALLSLTALMQTVELKTYDLRVRQTTEVDGERDGFVLIDIDETSIRKLEPLVGRWPWPRLIHGQAIDFLARSAARAILYDVVFTERDRRSFTVGDEQWTGAESDRQFAEAVRRAGNVVVMADTVAEPIEGAPPQVVLSDLPAWPTYHLSVTPEARPVVVLPYDELAHAAHAIGHNFFVLDADGPVRRVVPFVTAGDRPLPSGSLAASVVAGATAQGSVNLTHDALTVGLRRIPVIEQRLPSFGGERRTGYRALVRYGRPFRHISFYDVFYAEQQILAGVKPDLDPALFRGKVVLIGTTAPGLADVFVVPLRGKMAGFEVHANFVDSVLTGHTMTPARWGTEALALVGVALVVAVVAVWFGPWAGVIAALLVFGALWWGSVVLFRGGTWLTVMPSAVAIALTAFGGTAYHYFVEGREKRLVKQLFSRFVSQDIYEQLLREPSRAVLGGARRQMTVLFSDIRGFTSLSEQSSPEAVVATLNDYFTRMVNVIVAHRGTVDKFVGDMVMALFGAPVDDPDHADRAVQAALAMAAELDRINVERRARGEAPLDTGIGINSGEMVAGLIGSERILSYTVIGDAVNLGSRLESLNKQYGTHIIISDATRALLKKRYDMRPLGDVVVKGRSQPVSIFEVKDIL